MQPFHSTIIHWNCPRHYANEGVCLGPRKTLVMNPETRILYNLYISPNIYISSILKLFLCLQEIQKAGRKSNWVQGPYFVTVWSKHDWASSPTTTLSDQICWGLYRPVFWIYLSYLHLWLLVAIHEMPSALWFNLRAARGWAPGEKRSFPITFSTLIMCAEKHTTVLIGSSKASHSATWRDCLESAWASSPAAFFQGTLWRKG